MEEFRLGASDLILTNEYIYQPYFRGDEPGVCRAVPGAVRHG